jgi:hypothetical protein
MGRPSRRPLYPKTPTAFYLRRVYLNSGGYDSGGAYWGVGRPLYRAESVDEMEMTYGDPQQAEMYVRANDRNEAKGYVTCVYPNAKFFN